MTHRNELFKRPAFLFFSLSSSLCGFFSYCFTPHIPTPTPPISLSPTTLTETGAVWPICHLPILDSTSPLTPDDRFGHRGRLPSGCAPFVEEHAVCFID
ncbi:hypothetical protein FPV67DRAFT_1665283 [Lyophyllum atratum]|nr:hypothetical protein FPV67DRAFT_1665283 [Lyophyllum atratum]